MSGKFFEAIKQLFPRSRAFELFADNSKRKFFRGIAELPEDIRREAELTYLDMFPATTRFPDRWEKIFALLFTNAEKVKRRKILDSMWKMFAGDQSASFLEFMLRHIDPRINVVENIPVSNPRQSSVAIVGVCGHETMHCGHLKAVCGYRVGDDEFAPSLVKNDATMEYNIPMDRAYWENCFFVCDFAWRNQRHEIIYVGPLRVNVIWKNYIEYIILKVKPVHTTAILFIDWEEGDPS